MNRNILYISSDGTPKDVTTLDYQYLVNALAKAYRNINEATTLHDFYKYNDNIFVLTNEISERNKKYFEETFKGEE